MQGILHSVQVGRRRLYDAHGDAAEKWTSAIDKTPVSGPVSVGKTSLAGDEQADLVHHGGLDKALLGYSWEHYAKWNEELPGLGFEPGAFGENLTISGIAEATCCIGDTFRIGGCLLQITQPRQPCWKLARRWNLPKLVALVQRTSRTGWYFRVLQEGTIGRSMPVELVDRPYPKLTVAWASSVMYAQPRRHEDDLLLAECPALSEAWRQTLLKRGIAPTATSLPHE